MDITRTFEFDPANHRRLHIQDQLVQEHGAYPWWPNKPLGECGLDVRDDGSFMVLFTPSFDGWYNLNLPKFIADLRNAVLLPLCDDFLLWLRTLLEGAEAEQLAREGREQRATIRRRQYGPSDWESADLLAEVEAVCGQGRKLGAERWFRCPWHDDKAPSLEVNAEKRVWHCWGCGVSGGVVEWRRRNGR